MPPAPRGARISYGPSFVPAASVMRALVVILSAAMARLFDSAVAIALDKPAGVSMATSTREDKSAAGAVARLLEACGEDPDERLLLVHRLDVGTSGVVLLAKNDDAHRALSRTFQSREAKKTYRALVWGHPRPPSAVFEDPL